MVSQQHTTPVAKEENTVDGWCDTMLCTKKHSHFVHVAGVMLHDHPTHFVLLLSTLFTLLPQLGTTAWRSPGQRRVGRREAGPSRLSPWNLPRTTSMSPFSGTGWGATCWRWGTVDRRLSVEWSSHQASDPSQWTQRAGTRARDTELLRLFVTAAGITDPGLCNHYPTQQSETPHSFSLGYVPLILIELVLSQITYYI